MWLLFVINYASYYVRNQASKLLICNLQDIFQRYDRDRSGKIDVMELRDALYGLGYAVPGSVLQLLISKYDNRSGQRVELDFDSFVE